MKKSRLIAIIVGVAALVGVAQYFYGPKRIKIQEKIVVKEIEKVVTKTVVDTVVRERIIAAPDGTTTTERITETKDRSEAETDRSREATTDRKTEIRKGSSPSLELQLGVGINPLGDFGKPVFYGSVNKQLLGPLGAGLWATGSSLNSATIGGFLSWRF